RLEPRLYRNVYDDREEKTLHDVDGQNEFVRTAARFALAIETPRVDGNVVPFDEIVRTETDAALLLIGESNAGQCDFRAVAKEGSVGRVDLRCVGKTRIDVVDGDGADGEIARRGEDIAE